MLLRAVPRIGVAALALSAAALALSCGGSSGGDSQPTPALRHTPSHGGGATELSAKDNKFDRNSVTAPAGQDFSIFFTNNDAAPHNVAIYTTSSADEELFVGETFSGPDQVREYVFRTPDDGDYFFRCDVHPDTMTGEFKVD
jgi:plastocyanin